MYIEVMETGSPFIMRTKELPKVELEEEANYWVNRIKELGGHAWIREEEEEEED